MRSAGHSMIRVCSVFVFFYFFLSLRPVQARNQFSFVFAWVDRLYTSVDNFMPRKTVFISFIGQHWCWWQEDVGDIMLRLYFTCLWWWPILDVCAAITILVTRVVTNIPWLSPTHFVPNIRHQHRCSRFITQNGENLDLRQFIEHLKDTKN